MTFHLDEFLPYRLSVAASQISRRFAARYAKEAGLTIPEWRVLAHLSRCGAVSVRDIHSCVNLEKPRVSRAVARLETQGLVSKAPVDLDGRLVAISLTDRGREVLDDIVPIAKSLDQTLRDSVDARELAVFCRVMERMHASLDRDPAAKPRSRMDLTGLDDGSASPALDAAADRQR